MESGICACSTCAAEVHLGDNFCQECGAAIKAVDLLSREASANAQVVLTCLNCGCQYDGDSHYCSRCGSLLADVGVYTTAAQGPVPPPARTMSLGSPLLKRGLPLERQSAPVAARFSPVIVELSVAALLLAFFALVVLWYQDLDRIKTDITGKTVYEKARQAMAASQPAEAVGYLDKLVALKGGLNSGERNLLNEALFCQGQKQAGEGQLNLAIASLLRVSPEYKNYAKARALGQIYAERAQAESAKRASRAGSKPDSQSESPESAAGAGNEAGYAVATGRQAGTAGAANANKAMAKGSTVSPSKDKLHEGRQIAVRQKAAPAHGRGANLDEQLNANSWLNAAQNQPRAAGAGGAGGGEPQVKYTDGDIVRYNKLLADFFGAPAGQSGSGAGQTPPSLKEWLEQGRPNF